MKLSDRLFEEGVFAQGIAFPTVARDKARVRTIVTATHTREELQFALDAFARGRAGARSDLIACRATASRPRGRRIRAIDCVDARHTRDRHRATISSACSRATRREAYRFFTRGIDEDRLAREPCRGTLVSAVRAVFIAFTLQAVAGAPRRSTDRARHGALGAAPAVPRLGVATCRSDPVLHIALPRPWAAARCVLVGVRR